MSISVVRDNIAKAVKLFAFQHTPVSVTGTATETTLFSTTIPGGTLGVNGVLGFVELFSYAANSPNTATYKTKFGGVTFVSNGIGSTNLSSQVSHWIRNRNAVNSQICANSATFFGGSTAANVTGAVDTSVDQVLAVTGQLVTPTNTKSVTSLTRSGSTATATVTAHGYANGQSVLMAGANETEYNGTFVISNVTTNTFDYTVTGTPATPATGTITAALWDTLTLESVDVEVKKA